MLEFVFIFLGVDVSDFFLVDMEFIDLFELVFVCGFLELLLEELILFRFLFFLFFDLEI